MNWSHLISASLKNQAGLATLEKAKEFDLEDGGRAAVEVSESERSDEAVFVRRNGERVWFEVGDPLLLESLSALSYEGTNHWGMRALRGFKKYFTLGVTMNPEFIIANLMRDTLHGMAVSELSTAWGGIRNVVRGVRAQADPEMKAHLMAGGGEMHFGHFLAADPEAARYLIRRREAELANILSPEGFWQKFKLNTIDRYREIASGAENVNRMALYRDLRAKGVSHFEASFAARDLMDFSQHGSFAMVRFLTQSIPFLNARLQGLDKAGRAGKLHPGKFFSVIGGVMLASIGLYLMFRDDDDFKARARYDRDLYYWVKINDVAYRFPKPFEVGVIATLGERLMEQAVDNNAVPKEFLLSLQFAIFETFAFNPVPQAIKPALETWLNYNFFTERNIENVHWRGSRSKAERRRWYTPEAAVGLSRGMSAALPEGMTLSPVQIEHLFRGYLGWMGAIALDIPSQLSRLGPISRPDARPEDYEVMGRFIRTQPARNVKYTQYFYDALNEVRQIRGDINFLRGPGSDRDRAARIQADNQTKLRYRRYLEQQSRKLSAINRQMLHIRFHETMTGAEKRRKLDDLMRRKNTITERAYSRVRGDFSLP
jgi:hypothetical protein